MPFVQHNDEGTVTGLYHQPQPGYAEDFLPDDAPEIIAFRNPPAETPAMSAEDLWEVLRTRNPPLVTDADVPADRRQPPRRL